MPGGLLHCTNAVFMTVMVLKLTFAVADVGADADTVGDAVQTLAWLQGLVAKRRIRSFAESHVIGNVDMLQQDYDKSC